MANSDDLLNSLLTQPPYSVQANTEDFIEKLCRSNATPKEFGERFEDAVKQHLKFGVTVTSDLDKDRLKK